jgi:hypothetical protein
MSDERPPLFRRWSGWYWVLVAELALTILLLGWLTRVYS